MTAPLCTSLTQSSRLGTASLGNGKWGDASLLFLASVPHLGPLLLRAYFCGAKLAHEHGSLDRHSTEEPLKAGTPVGFVFILGSLLKEEVRSARFACVNVLNSLFL